MIRVLEIEPRGRDVRGGRSRSAQWRLCLLLGLGLPVLPLASACRSGPVGEVGDAFRDYSAELPVFPGAEGFGTSTPAGRGGRILRVTNLEPSGPGSLAEAIGQAGPRVVIFEVGGQIAVENHLVVSEPFVTIAGQTAPSPGITLTGGGLIVETHDVLVQHLRVRVGDQSRISPTVHDAMQVLSPGRPRDGSLDVYNVVFDHCSFAWAIDEVGSTWYPGVGDITIRRSIFAEGLANATHPKGEHSKGLLIGDHSKRVAIIGNLLAHNTQRNPFIKGDVSALVANNLIYNPGNEVIHFADREGAGPLMATVVGNVVIPGPSSGGDWPSVNVASNVADGSRIYLEDNEAPRRGGDSWAIASVASSADPRTEEAPVMVAPLTLIASTDLADVLLADVGARPVDRDPVDARIVAEVRAGQGRIIDSQDEVGGLPVVAPTSRTASTPADPNADIDGNGYTDLEEWLHAAAAAVEGR